MMYLCAFFIPPLYFMIRNKWGAFFINSFFYGIACILLLSIAFIPIAPLFWLVAMAHAMWYLRKEMIVEHAEILATKMAEKMKQTSNV